MHSDHDDGERRTRLGKLGLADIAPFAELGSEILFVLLPFVVAIMVLAYKNQPSRILEVSAWSMAAAVLFGQAIVKLLVGAAKSGRFAPYPIGLVVSAGIVLGLAPSLVILAMIELSDGARPWLEAAQFVEFFLSLAYFLYFGAVAESAKFDAVPRKVASARVREIAGPGS